MLPYDTGKFHGIPVGADSISARHCKMCKYIGGKTMKSSNIPEVKLGIIAVSRDCFPIALSEKRRAAISAACAAKGTDLYECKTTVENEHDIQKAVAEVTAAGCNALTVFLGNFGPETPETLIAKHFDGPCMFVAAAEGDGDMINGRGDAYCGMLNCSYNLGMRHLKGYIPEYPVGTAEEIADKIAEFVPIARTILGVRDLKIITFGPRPQDFFACNAPIKGLYELGVEIEENSELDLLVSYKEHAGDPRIADVCKDMAAEMGEGHYYPDLLTRMAQFDAFLPIFGLLGCGESEKFTADDLVLIHAVYYGTERNPVYCFALKKEENGWLFSADCLVGEQKEHYASFESFPIPAEDAAGFLHIISEDGEIKKLYRHRNPIRFFHISDVPARSLGMTFCDGSTMEKDAELGDRALDYLYVLADRYYKDAESSAETPPDTATS